MGSARTDDASASQVGSHWTDPAERPQGLCPDPSRPPGEIGTRSPMRQRDGVEDLGQQRDPDELGMAQEQLRGGQRHHRRPAARRLAEAWSQLHSASMAASSQGIWATTASMFGWT